MTDADRAVRTVVLIPASATDAESVYWANFVWRVTDAIRRERLGPVRVVVAKEAPDDPR